MIARYARLTSRGGFDALTTRLLTMRFEERRCSIRRTVAVVLCIGYPVSTLVRLRDKADMAV